MNTTANLLVILIFLAAFYTFLGLISGIAEGARELVVRPQRRRLLRRSPRRRTPRRRAGASSGGARRPRPQEATVTEKAMSG
jgi:hypothetical protein